MLKKCSRKQKSGLVLFFNKILWRNKSWGHWIEIGIEQSLSKEQDWMESRTAARRYGTNEFTF